MEEYLHQNQSRSSLGPGTFRHLFEEKNKLLIQKVQKGVGKNWQRIVDRSRSPIYWIAPSEMSQGKGVPQHPSSSRRTNSLTVKPSLLPFLRRVDRSQSGKILASTNQGSLRGPVKVRRSIVNKILMDYCRTVGSIEVSENKCECCGRPLPTDTMELLDLFRKADITWRSIDHCPVCSRPIEWTDPSKRKDKAEKKD